MSSSRFSRLCALLILGSVLTGVLAPGAVAISRDDIRTTAAQVDLSGDVRDFLTKALEDAMVRAALVGPVSVSLTTTTRRPDAERPVMTLPVGLLESGPADARIPLQLFSQLTIESGTQSPVLPDGPVHPRAP
ncbi:MAG: hypothetical protein OXT73_02760 [Bacteroidota bacterium]|nr:hypothetical protein [Bacteroidota bacterium]